MENKISISLSTDALNIILDALKTIEQNLPVLINLTDEERKTIPKMGDKSLAFVNKAFEYARQNPSLVPTFLDLNEFGIDTEAVISLNKVLVPLRQLTEKLDDTTMLSGSEAYTAALVFYNAVKGAAKAGVPGTKTVYDDLQSRFPGRGRNTSPVVP